MNIALVTCGFRPKSPGGVAVGIIRILEMLELVDNVTVSIFNFTDNIKNHFFSFENLEKVQPGMFISSFGKYRVYNITTSFALLECMRYRTRPRFRELFAKYDLIVVRTGFLQFANVVPNLKQRVVIIVSTRLKWERQSQYKSMGTLKRTILRMQLPVLHIQEKRVLNSFTDFSVENTIMQNWITESTGNKPKIWYPVSGEKLVTKRVDSKLRHNTYFISVGRLNESRKGWSRLMNAYKMAFDADKTLPELKIMGWGNFNLEDTKTFDSLRDNYPIKLLSNISDEKKMLYLANAFFFLQTSFEEGLGYAGIEALSFGIPLLCSYTYGSNEYVKPNKNGFLVSQGNDFTRRFSESILATRTIDYDSLSKCAITIYEQNFSFEKSKSDFFKIFPELDSAKK